MTNKTLIIMAGGTGGHVFPALAVARYLADKGWTIRWLGTEKGMEVKLVSPHYPMDFITIQGLRGKGLRSWLTAPFRILRAIHEAMNVFKQQKPDVVLGMGGFVTGPGGVAARLLGIPLVIHEQNAVAGMTNKLLAPLAASVCESFPHTINSKHVHTTGNPVRADIVALPTPDIRFAGRQGPLRLLVLGGSLGAKAINEMVPQALGHMCKRAKHLSPLQYSVWHQTGAQHLEATIEQYKAAGVEGRVVPFIDNMAEAYGWADLVICRAGALTIAELIASGLSAILIPYPLAVDDHQTYNGQSLVAAQSAWIIPQSQLTSEGLAEHLRVHMSNRDTLLARALAARALQTNDATARVAAECEGVIHAKGRDQ
ncbi:MAG: undecaprenyldiphospho-muramoylpentapeptide beta-N-acetylglucosaminyltransferase [Gammaproteobacteria bacterium]